MPRPTTNITTGRGGRLRPFRLSRMFKAAKQDRLVADWLSVGGDLNQELKSQLSILRVRAREQEQNSNLARAFLALCETHIVGPDGFTLQVQTKDRNDNLDRKLNKRAEREFRKWSRRGVCDITGKFSFKDAIRVSVRTAARDGELLIRMHDVQPTRRNPWGFVIELLDPARLDHQLNEDLRNGNRIRLGVELNPAGRPVAYHLKKGERAGWVIRRDTHERVPAEDLIHWFDADRPEQLRGVTWMASAMLSIHQLDGYQEAAIVAGRSGATKMGFYTQEETGMGRQMVGDDVADGEDEDGNPISQFEPGHLEMLPKGVNFTPFDPKYPHENYDPFTKSTKRDMAMGLRVSYHALTGDLTDVNFSSIRSGTLEEREQWKVRQDSVIEGVLFRISERFFSNAVFHKRFGTDVSQEELITRLEDHKWQGRRWDWVDPLKDIKAVVEAINAGLLSPQLAAAMLGRDVEELLEQIAEYQAMVEEKKITFPVVGPAKLAEQEEKEEEGSNANSKEND